MVVLLDENLTLNSESHDDFSLAKWSIKTCIKISWLMKKVNDAHNNFGVKSILPFIISRRILIKAFIPYFNMQWRYNCMRKEIDNSELICSSVARVSCAKKYSCAPVNKNYRVWSEKYVQKCVRSKADHLL